MARVDPSKIGVIQETMKKEDDLRYRWSLEARAKVERLREAGAAARAREARPQRELDRR
jgi:hypothetical protein